jgi:hypothetical protein
MDTVFSTLLILLVVVVLVPIFVALTGGFAKSTTVPKTSSTTNLSTAPCARLGSSNQSEATTHTGGQSKPILGAGSESLGGGLYRHWVVIPGLPTSLEFCERPGSSIKNPLMTLSWLERCGESQRCTLSSRCWTLSRAQNLTQLFGVMKEMAKVSGVEYRLWMGEMQYAGYLGTGPSQGKCLTWRK